MTTTAIIMMVVAMVTVWGGLLAATLNLHRRHDPAEDDTDLDPRSAFPGEPIG